MTTSPTARNRVAGLPRLAPAGAVVDATVAQPLLDYYAIRSTDRGGRSASAVEGILVESFVLADDYTTTALNSAAWTPAEPRWSSAATISRELRRDPAL